MNEVAQKFLIEHRLKSWLPQIIDALHERNRRAHVNDIANSAVLSERCRRIGAVRETITRTINDHCSDAGDVIKDPPAAGDPRDIFQRVAPATYRLRVFPKKPDVCNLVRIEFEDERMDRTWQMFVEAVSKSPELSPIWKTASNESRIAMFAKFLDSEKGKKLYGEACRRIEWLNTPGTPNDGSP
jgi:hypothetical protein